MIVALTLPACYGGHELQGRWLDRWGNLATAIALIAVGTAIATGLI